MPQDPTLPYHLLPLRWYPHPVGLPRQNHDQEAARLHPPGFRHPSGEGRGFWTLEPGHQEFLQQQQSPGGLLNKVLYGEAPSKGSTLTL